MKRARISATVVWIVPIVALSVLGPALSETNTPATAGENVSQTLGKEVQKQPRTSTKPPKRKAAEAPKLYKIKPKHTVEADTEVPFPADI